MPELLPATKVPATPSRFFTEYYSAAFLFLIAIFVLAAIFVLRPLIDTIKETNAMTQAEIQVADSERKYLASLDGSIVAAQTISPTVLDRVSEALPDAADIPLLLVHFGSAAAVNAIKIDTLSFAEAKAPPKSTPTVNGASAVLPLDITLVIRAHSYFDVKRFLADLETSLRVIDVIGMSSSGGGGDVTYSLQLRTYTFSAPTKSNVIR